MSFYETPRRNASDSTTSTRSMNRGHRREHSDPCPLPSPGLPHKALSTPELLRSKTVGDPCSAIRRSCSSLAALRTGKEPVPPNADGFEELREGDEFFDNFSWLFVLLAVILRYVWHNNVSSFLLIWWILPAMIPEQFMLDEAVDPRGDWTAMGLRASLFTAKTFRWMHLADGHPAMEIGIRWCLIVILTLFGQWVCAAASRRLAIILMRDRNLSKRDADHPLRGSRGSV